jgi:small subunit ribosomal protein S1
MGVLLEGFSETYKRHRRGDVVDGVVVRVDRDEVLVDIGAKSEGVVPINEIPRSFMEGEKALAVGSQVLAYVIQGEDAEGRVTLSLTRALAERGWRDLEVLREQGGTVEGEILEHNKGGLIARVMGVRGFIPLSQIADLRRSGEESIEQRLEGMRGRKVLLKVIEINRRRNRLILSERAALQERRARDKERLLNELQPGEKRTGIVSSICDFGAFVDLGGADGLVHLSELSWGQVTHPSQVLKPGQEVEVYVVGIDRENRKIALSLKRLQEEPWARVSAKYQIGAIVPATITKLATFGAFAQLELGIEGLVHISELSDERITHPKQVVREGERVQLRVIRVDPARHRLGLSLRQVEYQEDLDEGAESPAAADPAVGAEPALAPSDSAAATADVEEPPVPQTITDSRQPTADSLDSPQPTDDSPDSPQQTADSLQPTRDSPDSRQPTADSPDSPALKEEDRLPNLPAESPPRPPNGETVELPERRQATVAEG